MDLRLAMRPLSGDLVGAALGVFCVQASLNNRFFGRGIRVPRSGEETMANAEAVLLFRMGVITSFVLAALFVVAQ
jgi:hypothetical protein